MEHRNDSSKILSTLISRSLCIDGFSSDISVWAKYKSLILQYLFFSANGVLERIEGGSVAEGTSTPDSDADSMIVLPDVIVKTSLENTKDKKSTGDVFFLHTFESQPGYARLRLLRLSDKRNGILEGYKSEIRDLLIHTEDGAFLSSEKFVNFFTSLPHGTHSYRHGPCVTSKHVDVHGFIKENPGTSLESDIAHALECTDWPVEAREWITRKRFHEWPQQDLVKKIACTKCYVVPVGNPLSKHHAHEWRVSFLLGERELVWSFNDTQLQCYILLKRLVKLFLETIAQDQISSYNIKTVMFWISEENGLCMWQPENLLGCVKTCLDRLRDCVSKKQLTHYFNCQANLFGHKFENDSQRKLVLNAIDDMETNLSSYALKIISSDWQWPSVWEGCVADIDNLQKLSEDAKVLDGNPFTTTKKATDVRTLYRIMYNILLHVTTVYVEPKQLVLQLKAFEHKPPEAVDTLVINMTKLFIDLRLAMVYFREMVLHENEAFQRYIESIHASPKDMIEMASGACGIDAMSGHLYLASLLLTFGDHSKSVENTQKLLHQHKHLVYPGFCSKYNSIRLQNNGVSIPEMGTKFVGEELRTSVAYDMIFSYKDVYCVPYPVKFECALAQFDSNHDNFVTIHPSVYAYFLLCYGQYLSKQHSQFKETLDLFQKNVLDTKGGHERYHGLNLLAFCYLLDSNLQKAFELFKESIYETQMLSGGNVQNAAAYYIAIILNAICQKGILAQGIYIYKRGGAIDK